MNFFGLSIRLGRPLFHLDLCAAQYRSSRAHWCPRRVGQLLSWGGRTPTIAGHSKGRAPRVPCGLVSRRLIYLYWALEPTKKPSCHRPFFGDATALGEGRRQRLLSCNEEPSSSKPTRRVSPGTYTDWRRLELRLAGMPGTRWLTSNPPTPQESHRPPASAAVDDGCLRRPGCQAGVVEVVVKNSRDMSMTSKSSSSLNFSATGCWRWDASSPEKRRSD